MKMDLKVNLYKFLDWINNLNMYKLPVIFIYEKSRNKVNVLESAFRLKENFSLR